VPMASVRADDNAALRSFIVSVRCSMSEAWSDGETTPGFQALIVSCEVLDVEQGS